MRCVILCGGKGERLLPLTENTKKAFLPLGNKRVIDHIVEVLPEGIPYTISMNDNGALSALREVAQGNKPLLVICGDNYFSDSLSEFVKNYSGNTIVGVYDVNDTEIAKHCGVIKLDKKRSITDFVEKPEKPDTTLVSIGLYIFPPRVFKYISEIAGENPIGNLGLAIMYIRKFEEVFGFPISGRWFDIGSFQGYQAANEFEKSKFKSVKNR
jgi:glucose-1-phosphate thymidylyltransferase